MPNQSSNDIQDIQDIQKTRTSAQEHQPRYENGAWGPEKIHTLILTPVLTSHKPQLPETEAEKLYYAYKNIKKEFELFKTGLEKQGVYIKHYNSSFNLLDKSLSFHIPDSKHQYGFIGRLTANRLLNTFSIKETSLSNQSNSPQPEPPSPFKSRPSPFSN